MAIEPSGEAGSNHPKCRPDPAGIGRHVCKVKHDEGMLIRLASRNTNAVTAAARRNNVDRVSSHVNDAVGHVPQVCVVCIRLWEVIDEAMRGIIFLISNSAWSLMHLLQGTYSLKVKYIKEVVTAEIIDKRVGSRSHTNQFPDSEECIKMHVDERFNGQYNFTVGHESEQINLWKSKDRKQWRWFKVTYCQITMPLYFRQWTWNQQMMTGVCNVI